MFIREVVVFAQHEQRRSSHSDDSACVPEATSEAVRVQVAPPSMLDSLAHRNRSVEMSLKRIRA